MTVIPAEVDFGVALFENDLAELERRRLALLVRAREVTEQKKHDPEWDFLMRYADAIQRKGLEVCNRVDDGVSPETVPEIREDHAGFVLHDADVAQDRWRNLCSRRDLWRRRKLGPSAFLSPPSSAMMLGIIEERDEAVQRADVAEGVVAELVLKLQEAVVALEEKQENGVGEQIKNMPFERFQKAVREVQHSTAVVSPNEYEAVLKRAHEAEQLVAQMSQELERLSNEEAARQSENRMLQIRLNRVTQKSLHKGWTFECAPAVCCDEAPEDCDRPKV